MDQVNHPAIIDTLRRRYRSDKIYTGIADILVAMNPFKWLPVYTPAHVIEYAKGDQEAPPHPFKTTMNAYNGLRESRCAQAILISGESGAGKTETTKQCLKMLSECAGGGRKGEAGVEERLLSTNPVLETLGNAKTVRNDNSSRFGKFMQIHFDSNFRIAGCDVVDYLLEKSRVTSPGPNERSYHKTRPDALGQRALRRPAVAVEHVLPRCAVHTAARGLAVARRRRVVDEEPRQAPHARQELRAAPAGLREAPRVEARRVGDDDDVGAADAEGRRRSEARGRERARGRRGVARVEACVEIKRRAG